MRGDCSIRINGLGFTPEQIDQCSKKQGLLSIEIELSASEKCSCAACISKPLQPVLSPEEIMTVVDQAQKMGVQRVILVDSDTGPYPHLGSIIEQLRIRNLEVELFAGDTEITAGLARFLFDHQVKIAIENDSVIDNLKQAGYCTAIAPELAMRIFVSADNVEQIPLIWRGARNQNIEPRIQIITPRDGNNQPLRYLEPNRAHRLFEDLAQIDQQEFNRNWNIPPAFIGRSCKRHLFAAHVTACGNIFACVGITIPLGNIRTESLADILTLSEVIEDIRAFPEKVKEPCRTCSKTTDCYGCRGAAYQLTGDYLAGDQLCWKTNGTPIESLPFSVESVVPHGPSMRMVDQLVQIGERKATTTYTIPKDSIWVDANGRLEELTYIEMIAQSFGSSHGFHITEEQRKHHRGLLLGVTNLVISGQAHAGEKLTIEIRKITRFGDFGIVEGDVRHEGGRIIATGTIKIWRPAEETAKALIP